MAFGLIAGLGPGNSITLLPDFILSVALASTSFMISEVMVINYSSHGKVHKAIQSALCANRLAGSIKAH